jgi:hypothetical protein
MRKFATIEYKGFLWLVKAILPERHISKTEMLKKKYDADLCLRKRGELYFVEIIEDVEIIEETKNEK